MPRTGDPTEIKVGSGLANQDSVYAPSLSKDIIPDDVLNGIIQGTGKEISASKIKTSGSQGKYFTENAQGNFNEISFLLPVQPPTVGNYSLVTSFNGITDWGNLKLNDAGLIERGLLTSSNLDEDIYPYYWVSPEVADRNPPFNPIGNDPSTDPVFNLDASLTPDPTYTGGGEGQTHTGGFPRFGQVIETNRILPPLGGVFQPIVISGTLFPADRGVLALLHWPAGGNVAMFLAQNLDVRCVAALLLGQGVNGQTPTNCDGDPGGIFSNGPGFPGREEGQLDLAEIHAGLNNQTGNPLPAGAQPGAGQVRLGTDPIAGPTIPGGIPILGGTSIATGGGNDNNFFRYRLPYLSDYENLFFTPEVERPRYFEKPLVSLDNATNLTKAGNYDNFSHSFATYQIARYRHRFQLLLNFGPINQVADQGSYILIHFKRETDFESFVRDGILPNDLVNGYDIWSANLSNWDDPEDTANQTDGVDASIGYHVLRSATANDPEVILPNVVTATYDYTNLQDEVMWCSGVQYFVTNAAAGVGEAWKISSSTLVVDNLFSNSFLLGESADPADITPGLKHRNPLFLYMGGYTTDDQIITPGVPTFIGTPKTQRVEFDYSELGSYDLATSPINTDQANVSHTNLDPALQVAGNDTICHFWTDARLRAFGRRPNGHESISGSAVELLFDKPGGKNILFHTTSHGASFNAPNGIYGNFVIPPNNDPRPQLENALKDTQELFLDEVYRVSETSQETLDPTWDGVKGNLVGPGLPFAPNPIELPVRFASSSAADFGFASYLKNLFHEEDLAVSAFVSQELQISGFPDRNPPLSDGVTNPVPFSGMLRYPKDNYSVGYRPSVVDGDVTTAQPDYSGIINDRRYFRVLDAAFSNDPTPEPGVIGQPFLRLRIEGLKLEDYAFNLPGPGSTKIAIQIKIPGLTSWMDIGRRDGDGPSKQDPFMDGAGCQLIGPETFDSVDSETGVVYSQVKIHVGPATNIFGTTGLVSGVSAGIAPIYVRVTIRKAGDDLDFSQGGPNGTVADVRALTGIRVLRHSLFV